jgi:hypothetical protein
MLLRIPGYKIAPDSLFQQRLMTSPMTMTAGDSIDETTTTVPGKALKAVYLNLE